MKIAFFHELPPGGARRAINEYARQLKKDHLVDLFLVDDNKSSNEDKFYSNVFFYRFIPKFWQGKNWRVRLYKDTVELFQIYKLHRKIAQDIDKRAYDVVLVSASKFIEAPFIMRFLKTPFVFFPQDPYYRIIYDSIFSISKDLDFFRYWYEKINRFVRKILDKQNVRCAKVCLAPSKYIASLFSKTYNKPVEVVHDGVDTFFFKPSKKKKNIDIFYIGSHEPVDGYNLLDKTVKLMNEKPKVRAIFTEEEWISDDKILRNLYQRTKIMFCPARKEGLGLVLLEALSCGTLVVALDEAGHREIIKHGENGYLVRPDPKKIAEILDRLLSNPKEIRRLENNGRLYIKKYWTWKKLAKELENVLVTRSRSVYANR